MAGIGVEEVKTVNITTTDGQKIKAGDALVLCIKGEDILCRFIELDKGGYFVTESILDRMEPSTVKYRLNSITECYKVTAFEWSERGKQKKAATEAGQGAAQDVLQPGA